MENTPECTADKQPVAASANNSAVPAKNAGHRPGELPGNKPSPTEQNLRPILEIKDITKEFEAFTAVNKVNLTLYEGEIFALLGSSGCGKSTLLRMLAGFETPTSGSILLDGEELIGVPPYKRPVNMMFQSYALFPYMTVKQNIAFGLKQEHLPKSQIEERVEKMLHLVHMEDYVDRKPFQLSGGQRQRVALARSLAKEPRVLLLDEPMGALDKKLREQMRLELVDIINSVGVTCLMVTHDQEEAMTMADRIVVMKSGEILQVDTPTNLYNHPNCIFVAGFIGSPQMNFFKGKLERNGDHLDFEFDGNVIAVNKENQPGSLESYAGKEIYLGIRPEHIHIKAHDNMQKVRATMEFRELLGADICLYTKTGTDRMVIRCPSTYEGELSQNCDFYFDMSKVHFFDAATERTII